MMNKDFDMLSCPNISVLMPCYNASSFIDDAIKSILSQSFRNFELIALDDGSTDDTLALLRAYEQVDHRVVVITKPNSGITDTLNVGLSRARGEWIARMDADDIASPDRLERQLRRTQHDPSVVLVGGGCLEVDVCGIPLRQHVYPIRHDDLLVNLLTMQAIFPHSSAFFRRSTALSLGGYRNRLNGAEDWDMWIRLSERGQICALEGSVLQLRKHSDSITSRDRGHRNVSLAACAAICHYRRIHDLGDPSDGSEEAWRALYCWVEQQLAVSGYFKDLDNIHRLRASLLDAPTQSLPAQAVTIFRHFLTKPGSLVSVGRRIMGINTARRVIELGAKLEL